MPSRSPAGAMAPPCPRRARRRHLFFRAGSLSVLVCASTLTGPASSGFDDVWRTLDASSGNPIAASIIWQIRLPQALMALLAGAALGLAGAEMQTVLNNPLASPFTLGEIGRAHV